MAPEKSAGGLSPREDFYIVWEKDIFPCYNGNVNMIINHELEELT